MQKTMACFLTEDKYIVLSEACFEIAWLMSLQREIGYMPTTPTSLVLNNQGGIFLAINPAYDC
jgi:hypothetical protein